MKLHNSKEFIAQYSKTVTPGMGFDASLDLGAWQRSARDRLKELLGLPLARCEDDFQIIRTENESGYQKITFEFQSEPGYYLECVMLCPLEQTGPLPAVICLQGHSTGKHISLGYQLFQSDTEDYVNRTNIAVQAVKNGYCAVAFDQRYMGSAGQNEKGNPQCFGSTTVFPTLLMGRTPIGERVWDVQRVIDVLEKHFVSYVDPEKILCTGNSGGGTTTFYAAAMDERIHLAVPSCAVCSFDDSIIPLSHCGCNYIPGIRKYFDMGDIGCLIAPRKVIVVNGDQDDGFPIEGAKKAYRVMTSAYEKAGRPENCHMIVGNGGHQYYKDDIWPKIREMMER